VALEFMSDLSVADWIVNDEHNNRDGWDRLVSFCPSGFEQYARLRYIPDPLQVNNRDELLALGDVVHNAHLNSTEDIPDYEQFRMAIETLARFTMTPTAYMLMWEGSGLDWPDWIMRGPTVNEIAPLTGRPYKLFRVTMAEVTSNQVLQGWSQWLDMRWGFNTPPAFFWPADRAWCFTSDTDPHWAGIGGTTKAISALLHNPLLDVVPLNPAQKPPLYY